MKKYKVAIEGDNFAIKLDDKVDKYGFFTTRFVEAKSPENAETLAITLIRDELKSAVLNDHSDPPVMFTDEIHEVDDFGDNISPGSGFTWFEVE